ncbi:MAG TPA: histidine kinase, partial [Telluria sp.]
MSAQRILNIALANEQDVVLVRQRARQVSHLLGFSQQDQVRIATAVSEVARAVCQGGYGGRAAFLIDEAGGRQALEVAIGAGPGSSGPLADDAVVTAHRLMDECRVEQGAGPALVTMRKALASHTWVGPARLAEVSSQLAMDSPVANTYLEVQLQNRELAAALAELRERQDDLLELTRELEDTNRGIVALYAEIEDKA